MSYLQNNAGVNYSLYYNILSYFETIMQNHPSIQEVGQGDIFEIDTNAYPFYPLGNVNILSANFIISANLIISGRVPITVRSFIFFIST